MPREVRKTKLHHEYGLHAALAARVIAYAETFGVQAASEAFHLHPTTIYRWRKSYANR